MGLFQIFLVVSFYVNGNPVNLTIDKEFKNIEECRALVTTIETNYDVLVVDGHEISDYKLSCRIPGHRA